MGERHIQAFIDSLDGELRVEEDAYLPLMVDGEQVAVSGVVDLVNIPPETVDIVDFKTNRGRHAESEYRKQPSVYYHVLDEWFLDREIRPSIFYTLDGTRSDVDPLTKSELNDLTKELLNGRNSST